MTTWPPESHVDQAVRPRVDWAIGIVIAVGVLLRCVQAFEDRALWLDEAMLALNIRRLSFFQLCGPLQYDQAAPLGFLWLQKLAASVVPDPEISARIVPWTAGCLALLCFTDLMVKIAGRVSLLAVTTMALSPTLVCYSGEGKQYSLDVLCSVLALSVAIRWVESPTRVAALRAALFCAVAPWLSHTGVFFLPGVLMLAAVFRNQTGWAVTSACAVAVVTSVLMLYLVNIRQVRGNPSLNSFWQSDYVPWKAIERGPTEFEAVAVWTIRKWWELVVRAPGLAPAVPPATGAWYAVAGMTILVTGLLWRVVSDFAASSLLVVYTVLPVIACLVAAALKIYPFGNRLLLFAGPLVFFLLGRFPLTPVWSRLRRYQLDVLVSAALLTWPLASAWETISEMKSVGNMFAPHEEEDIRPFVQKMLNAEQTQTGCYVFHAARPAFEYYSMDQTENVVFGTPGDADHYRKEVEDCLAKKKAWYFLYAHTAPWGQLEPRKAYEYLTTLHVQEMTSFRDDVRFFAAIKTQMKPPSGSVIGEALSADAASSGKGFVSRMNEHQIREL